MFEFLFHYPRHVFSKGELVLLGGWPKWVLAFGIVAGAAALAWMIYSRRKEASQGVRGWRSAVIWALQSSMLAGILTLLWQPAMLVSTLKPQQNFVAVLVDDSQSMKIADDGTARIDKAKSALDGGVIDGLQKRFQTRLYKVSDHVERIKKTDELKAEAKSTRLGDALKQVAVESAGLPLGAVILLSDGADNSGGIDLETISELRSRRIPIHTVGFGKERPTRDLELSDVQAPGRALNESRVSAQVSFQQHGYAGRKARLQVRESGRVLTVKEVTLKPDGQLQTESVMFQAGKPGAKAYEFSLNVLEGEENKNNNATSRLINVDSNKPKILYFEGEPRWEYKFIRRALEDDQAVRLDAIVRTTQNKMYFQVGDAKGLEQGFPAKVEDLFTYQGVILGSVEMSYFTTTQLETLKQFIDRRGGGLLLLGGRASLSEGGWGKSALAEALPVTLPDRKGTFQRDPANVMLSPQGIDSIITRLVEQPAENDQRWQKLPHLADYQDIGVAKAGATVLVDMSPGGRGRMPLFAIQNYGRGRVGVLGTSGTWRWQMSQPLEDMTHEIFWQQLARWLVTDTPGRVVVSTPRPMLFDETKVRIHADVRDKTYLPAPDAKVQAHIIGPEGITAQLDLTPDPDSPGVYRSEYIAEKPGSYMAEVVAKRGEEEVGREVLTFQKQDGVAENFHTAQNRELLEKLSTQTNGRYWPEGDLKKLPDEISYSEAGVTVRETRDLWNMPAVLLALFALRASEWLLRRKWGVV